MNQTVQKRARKTPVGTEKIREKVRRAPGRTNDPDRTRADILQVAELEFGEKGLAGARIDAIAEATRASKRMIYYYFGSKEGLYLAVLEEAYRRVRSIESELKLHDLDPEEALRRLVAFTFDHHLHHESYIRLVMSENMNRGEFLAQSRQIQELNRKAIISVRDLYERGVKSGIFRKGLDPVDIHASISALCFFNVSNRHTFSLIFQLDMLAQDYVAKRRESVVETIVRFVRKD